MRGESRSETRKEQKSEEAPHGELEGRTVEYEKVVGEESKSVRIGVKKEEEFKRLEPQAHKKPLLPRLPVIRSELKLTSKRLKPKVTLPLEVALTDKQRSLLYILYNMFRGKSVKEVVSVVGSALGVDVGDLLRELTVLEKLSLVIVDNNGVIEITSKGEVLAGAITTDKSVVNKVREAVAKVPKTPSIQALRVVKKLMDKENYLVSPEISRREAMMPVTPRISIVEVSPLEMSKSLSVYPKYKAETLNVPQMPEIFLSEVSVKTIEKTTPVTLKRGVFKERVSKHAGKVEEAVESKSVRLPSSLLTILFEPVKKYSVKGLLSVKPDRPVMIVAIKLPGEEYVATLLSILREIYRMKVGGLPIGRYTGTEKARKCSTLSIEGIYCLLPYEERKDTRRRPRD